VGISRSPLASPIRSRASLRVALAAATSFAGCAQSVVVRTEPPGAYVKLDGRHVGVPPPEGTTVTFQAARGDVPYELLAPDAKGPPLAVGTVPRSDVVWGTVALGIAGAACLAPTLALTGLVVANPVVVGAPVACLLTQNPGVCVTALAAPSWATLPCAASGAAVGASPLALAFFAEGLQSEVVLRVPAKRGARPAPEPLVEEAPDPNDDDDDDDDDDDGAREGEREVADPASGEGAQEGMAW